MLASFNKSGSLTSGFRLPVGHGLEDLFRVVQHGHRVGQINAWQIARIFIDVERGPRSVAFAHGFEAAGKFSSESFGRD